MRIRAAAALFGWISFLAGSSAGLVGVGGPLPRPPLLHPASLGSWLRRLAEPGLSPTVQVGFGMLRLAALALCCYLIAVTLASLVSHLLGWPRAARLADRAVPSFLQAVVRGGLGIALSGAGLPTAAGLTGAVPVSAISPAQHALPGHGADDPGPAVGSARRAGQPAPPGGGPPAGSGPVLEWVGPASRSLGSRPSAPPATTAGPPATLTPTTVPPTTVLPTTTPTWTGPTSARPEVPATAAPSTTAAGPAAGPPGSAAAMQPSSPQAAPALSRSTPSTWTVRPGDSFWSIADVVLQQAWGRPPTDAEIGPYWLELITANRARLLHPGIPDLIYTGQVFTVPPPPAG
jgi:hypothetical protein